MTTGRVAAAVLAVCCLSAALAGPAAAGIENPRFEVSVPEPVLEPGSAQTLSFTLANDAQKASDWVERADNVEVTVLQGETPIEVRSGPRSVGSLRDGQSAPVDVQVVVPADVPAGQYRLPVRVRYEYKGDFERQVVGVRVRVEQRPRLRVVDTATDLVVGERGTVDVTVENAGEEPARDVRLTLTSRSADLSVGGAETGSRAVGTLAPNESRTVSFVVAASDDARPQRYAMEVAAAFENARGVAVTSAPTTVGVTPREALTFAVSEVTADLSVGEEGSVHATVVNAGERTARAATVVLSTPSGSVRLPETTYPVGDLAPGASARVTFRATVPPSAVDGPRSFSLAVEYEDREGDLHRSDPVRFGATVAPERGRLRLEPVEATVQVDSSTRLVVAVTNVGSEPLSDVTARLDVGPPFTTETPSAFVPDLAAGETADLAFELTVSEDAVPGTQAVALNVTAERPDGGAVVTGREPVAVTVAPEPTTGGDTAILAAGVVVVLVVLGAGWYWLRRG